MKERILDI